EGGRVRGLEDDRACCSFYTPWSSPIHSMFHRVQIPSSTRPPALCGAYFYPWHRKNKNTATNACAALPLYLDGLLFLGDFTRVAMAKSKIGCKHLLAINGVHSISICISSRKRCC